MFQQSTRQKETLRGTIKPNENLTAENAARALRVALANADSQVVTDILAKSTNQQRQEIKSVYKQSCGRDLCDDIKKTFTGNFELLARGLLMKPLEFDAYCLHKSMIGLGTHESVLIEILVTRSNQEISAIKSIYKEKFGNELESDIKSDTSGEFRRLLISLANGHRKESTDVDVNKAVKDAEKLAKREISKSEHGEETFNSIMARESFPQLKAVFHAYEKLTDRDINSSIKAVFAGDLADGLLAIVDVVRNRNAYFANTIMCALKGLTRNDIAIRRIVVTRSEIDLFNIKRAYFSLTNKALVEAIETQICGENKYKKLLLAVIG
uniref:Annexin n=1 Tax=Phallusia mammillata TaxID=59560 RepID=A0A6F9D5Z0_9ASCI|nr:annexin-B12-like [Phallusia mammillata]